MTQPGKAPRKKRRSRPVDPEEAAFCQQAVALGDVTAAQVAECVEIQDQRRAKGISDPIAFLLVEKGYLDSTRIPALREQMRKAQAEPPAGGPAPVDHTEYDNEEDEAKREDLFAKVAVRLGFVSEGEIEKARALQARQAAKGKKDPLGFLLLQEGHLTSHQIKHVSDEVGKTFGKARIGGYELESELGRGGMGVVFRARQLSLQREVALKVIPKTVTTGRDFKERFFREARTAGKLNHPNIVKAIDAGETARHFFFAMELIEGERMIDLIRRQKRLPESRVLYYSLQIAQALKHAHANGLVHRDIKPENLLLDPEGETVKIADMGLAKSSEEKDASITKAGTTLGTPNYISPEQVQAKADVDIRADLYALGGTLYHMLTGTPPFTADSPALVIQKHLLEKPLAPRMKVPAISAEMNRIVLKLLEKDPKDRYPDPGGLLKDLEQLRRLGPDKAAKSTGAKAPGTRSGRPAAKPFPVLPVAGGALAILVVILLAVAFMGGKDPEPDRGGHNGGERGGTTDPDGEPDIPDPKEKQGQDALAEANRFAKDNPDRIDEIVARYQAVLDRFPRTAAFSAAREAIRRAEERRVSQRESILTRTLDEARSLADRHQYKAALDTLASFPGSRSEPGADAALRGAEEEIHGRAERTCNERIRVAEEAAARGNLDRAMEVLASVESFGMAGLWDRVKPILESLQRRKKAAAFRETHVRVLDRIAASGLSAGRQLLEEELLKVEDYDLKDLLRRDIVNIGKAEGVWAAVVREASATQGLKALRLTSGDVFLAGLSSEGDTVRLKGPEGERIVKIGELSSPDVRALSRASESALACFAWYVNRDLRFLLELSGGNPEAQGELGDVLQLALDASGAGLLSALDAFASGSPEPERLLALIQQYGGLPFFTAQEDALRLVAARAFSGLLDPFFFCQGPGPDREGNATFQYDFRSPFPFEQFLTAGRGAWTAGWGTLEQSTGQAGQVDAFAPGVWAQFDLEVEVLMSEPVQGVGFTFHEQADGRRYAFELRELREGLRAAFYFRPPGRPAMVLLAAPLDFPAPEADRFVRLSLSVKDGVFIGRFEDKEVRITADDRKAYDDLGHRELAAGRIGLRASSPCTFRRFKIAGRPSPGWAGSLPGPDVMENLTKPQGEAPLFDGGTLRGWETLAGTASVQGGAIRLSGPFSAVGHASGTLLDGRKDMQVRFQARRLGGSSYLLVGFRHGRNPRLLAVRPQESDPYPEGLAPGLETVDVPCADGNWHSFIVFEGPEGASLWVDGTRRFIVGPKEIREWPRSRAHLFGFGLGAAGGDWEVKDVVLTRKTF